MNLKRKQNIIKTEKLIIENFHTISQKLGMKTENDSNIDVLQQLEPYKDMLKKSADNAFQQGLSTTLFMRQINHDALYNGVEIPSPDDFYSQSKNNVMRKVLNWLGYDFSPFGVTRL